MDMPAGFRADMLPALEERLSEHYASAAPAIWIIVHLFLLVFAIVAYLMALHADIPAFLTAPQYALTKHIPDDIGE
jgi:hypothetical protein